jgi:hypothetical protein
MKVNKEKAVAQDEDMFQQMMERHGEATSYLRTTVLAWLKSLELGISSMEVVFILHSFLCTSPSPL